ncbi:CHAP domain-containing protein [Knoellia sp. S7-12]|uniref:CHAP domain-containing protein n=1 Tax=Knoellia sp. S7-12 TaxID=3126698 RepID=UPI0033695C77
MKLRNIGALASVAAIAAVSATSTTPVATAATAAHATTTVGSGPQGTAAALSTLRQESVDRANALLTTGVKYKDAAGTIRTSTRPSATRNVLEWSGSNTNRNEFNDYSDGYASGLDWCGYFVARVWTGENTPAPASFPRIPALYLRSQAWRTDAKTPYFRFAQTRLPQPGDVLVWQNGAGAAGVDNGVATGHVGVVTAVNATTKVVTSVEGNVAGDEINRRTYAWDADGPTLPDKHFMGHTARE